MSTSGPSNGHPVADKGDRGEPSLSNKRNDDNDSSSSSSASVSEADSSSSEGSSGASRASGSTTTRQLDMERRHSSQHHSHSRSFSESSERRLMSHDYQRVRQPQVRRQATRCIGVFGLSPYTTQHKVFELFRIFGPIERIEMIIDEYTHRFRGFCFIYFMNMNDARVAKDACTGMDVDERRIRVDYSIPQRPRTPTSGLFMDRRSGFNNRYRHHYGYSNGYSTSWRHRDYDALASPDDFHRRQRHGEHEHEYEHRHRQHHHKSSGHIRRSRSVETRSRGSRRESRQ
ncbi:transformer-2 sex-determining protein-like [Scaptodrosophila lebanonensis]|uniref:Transformer-2 sex-determining protein-like n=1 Tax=Drosophila lebanonensis TaxID=7225 RepID=A0A6J2T420_DROLE|nr:transformer-2 sex-determining protein-like [Scaptodrosophila lebanonensis]